MCIWSRNMENLTLTHLVFMFFAFCTIGWIQESTIESLYHKKVINRGFLRGPYIPIYGTGGMTMIVVCAPFRENPFMVFIVGMISCTILEYIVGALMEKLFNKQFWDYSMLKLTYKNRISLVSSLFWGVLSLFMIYILLGIIRGVCLLFEPNVLIVYNMIMMTAMSVDLIFTVNRQINLREALSKLSSEQRIVAVRKMLLRVGTPVDHGREWLLIRVSRAKLNLGIANKYDIEKCRDDNEEKEYQ